MRIHKWFGQIIPENEERIPRYFRSSKLSPEWKRQRKKAIDRDGCCKWCGENKLEILEVHHLIEASQGGTHTLGNLITLCKYCHFKISRLNRKNIHMYTREDIDQELSTGEICKKYRKLK